MNVKGAFKKSVLYSTIGFEFNESRFCCTRWCGETTTLFPKLEKRLLLRPESWMFRNNSQLLPVGRKFGAASEHPFSAVSPRSIFLRFGRNLSGRPVNPASFRVTRSSWKWKHKSTAALATQTMAASRTARFKLGGPGVCVLVVVRDHSVHRRVLSRDHASVRSADPHASLDHYEAPQHNTTRQPRTRNLQRATMVLPRVGLHTLVHTWVPTPPSRLPPQVGVRRLPVEWYRLTRHSSLLHYSDDQQWRRHDSPLRAPCCQVGSYIPCV